MKRLLLLACVALAGCPPAVGENVTCPQTFTCGDDITNNVEESTDVICTDPSDLEQRAEDIASYEAEFAEGCNGVFSRCNEPEGDFAVCSAVCVIGGECDIATAARVRLR